MYNFSDNAYKLSKSVTFVSMDIPVPEPVQKISDSYLHDQRQI